MTPEDWEALRQEILAEFGEDIDELVSFEDLGGQIVTFKKFVV